VSTAAVILDFNPISMWASVVVLLKQQLGQDVDVDAIGEQDFDADGELSVRTPAVRVVFGDEEATPIEMQGDNYAVEQSFGIICADQDLRDPQEQRVKALRLAQRVKRVLAGARLVTSYGEISEPVLYRRMRPLPTANVGLAYVPEFCVPGIAQFPAPNAQPSSGGQ
jgi:hypothetical protein